MTLSLKLEACISDDIHDVAREMVAVSKRLQMGVTLDFNEIPISAGIKSTPEEVVRDYFLLRDMKAKL